MSKNQITHVGVTRLCNTLNQNRYITGISLFGNGIGDESMEDIGELLNQNNIIKEFVIGNCNITDDGLNILTPYILRNRSLKTIDISWNKKITERSMPFLNEICLESCVEDIIMIENGLSDSNIVLINVLLSVKQRSIKRIDLSNRAVNDNTLQCLGFLFEKYNYYDIEEIK